MEITNDVIVSIDAKIPELKGTEEKVLETYDKLKNIKNKLWDLHQQVIDLRKIEEDLSRRWNSLNPLYNIEYGKEEINEIHNKTNIRIINKTDYRNKH